MKPNYLQLLRDNALHLGVEDISSIILDNPSFAKWSASSKGYQHHYGDGGLLQHTYEVVTLSAINRMALVEMGATDMPTEQEVFLAALHHDIGKVWDYKEIAPNNWDGTPHKRLIHHISRSAIEWSKAVERFPKYRDVEESVLHAILAHHGTREWGSPVAPKSKLAWLLHLSDALSARINDANSLDVVEHYKT